ncbi:hypothetical protein FE840_016095 [Peteryoungia desertarenae]|uniref:Uncharacterized protein n=1 Tax=Peteryoungia desertarenae TaxID=1813451 RepID=A0ABX6QQQ1_9HYPH|nr:hypothetical protein [Peteryoungia desertarenae]QLF70943.1 hypothetical protein FE840_016095 [Peteryoungia desertarenae]
MTERRIRANPIAEQPMRPVLVLVFLSKIVVAGMLIANVAAMPDPVGLQVYGLNR